MAISRKLLKSWRDAGLLAGYIDGKKLAARLRRLRLPAWRLATAIDVHPTTMSKMMVGRMRCQPERRRRIEIALCFGEGELVLRATQRPW